MHSVSILHYYVMRPNDTECNNLKDAKKLKIIEINI